MVDPQSANCGPSVISNQHVKKGKMKNNQVTKRKISNSINTSSRRRALGARVRVRAWLEVLLWMGLTTGLFWGQSAGAVSVTPLGTGQLPSGDFIVMTQLTLNPGDSVPWHYHPGTGLRVVISGTLTEDEGCGNPLVAHTAGSAFEEAPGHVHQIFNLGSDPVVVLRTDILPACYKDHGTIFVSGPSCEGDSGRSHLEPIEPCASAANDCNASKPEGQLADARQKPLERSFERVMRGTEVPPPAPQLLTLANFAQPMHGRVKDRTVTELAIRAD
jgi:quercetin dioxygenase-like cupin family protein